MSYPDWDCCLPVRQQSREQSLERFVICHTRFFISVAERILCTELRLGPDRFATCVCTISACLGSNLVQYCERFRNSLTLIVSNLFGKLRTLRSLRILMLGGQKAQRALSSHAAIGTVVFSLSFLHVVQRYACKSFFVSILPIRLRAFFWKEFKAPLLILISS